MLKLPRQPHFPMQESPMRPVIQGLIVTHLVTACSAIMQESPACLRAPPNDLTIWDGSTRKAVWLCSTFCPHVSELELWNFRIQIKQTIGLFLERCTTVFWVRQRLWWYNQGWINSFLYLRTVCHHISKFCFVRVWQYQRFRCDVRVLQWLSLVS